MAHQLYVLLGSNLGDPARHLSDARQRIGLSIGKVCRKSSLYQTAAWGKTDQPDFINQVLLVETRLDARACMKKILGIEAEMGRVRTTQNAARIIDIDILFYDDLVIHEAQLQIPHPRIALRRFTLIPLVEMSPGFRHPVSGKTMQELLEACTDPLPVQKI